MTIRSREDLKHNRLYLRDNHTDNSAPFSPKDSKS